MTKLWVAFAMAFSAGVYGQSYEWLKLKKYKVADLDDKVEETSALSFYKDRLFTLNDSGNAAELYELAPQDGRLVRTYPISGAANFDWEALACGGSFFYVADIGNNWGTRQDLKFYKVAADSMETVETIRFYYPEQTSFVRKPQANDWDAESAVFIDGELHLFTKEWLSYRTSHYVLPASGTGSEPVAARKLEEYPLGYVATDAAYYDGKLYTVGYTKKMEAYLTIFERDENGRFFGGKATKYYLGMTSSVGQIEGIAVTKEGIYISGERFHRRPFKVPQRLYFIPQTELK
ncbi:hypothetical protein [Bergeyella sp. RCAD1439]|uniref:hypothetical protein n=1 Tax=Bergeyella anatis TaxID=3113737 RepID=UPI002E183C37|nr:hypothetical protein [Bergeyella sp. RCAD1439]